MHGSSIISSQHSENVWSQTSTWTSIQLATLKLIYCDGGLNDIVTADLRSTNLPVDAERVLLPGQNLVPGLAIESIGRKFYNRTLQLLQFPDEPPVDSVARDLLDAADMEGNVVHFRPKPHMNDEWKGHNIASVPDYGIYIAPYESLMIIVEDKGAEHQLAGEMFVTARSSARYVLSDKNIYGMTLRGTSIRFYKAVFSMAYLQAPGTHQSVTIWRYPPQTQEPLDIRHPTDRDQVVRILCRIREQIESMA